MKSRSLQQYVDSAVTRSFMDLDKHVAWADGLQLYKVILDSTDTGWLGILKAHRGRNFFCAFVPCDSLGELVDIMSDMTERGQLQWQKDKYPTPWIKLKLGVK